MSRATITPPPPLPPPSPIPGALDPPPWAPPPANAWGWFKRQRLWAKIVLTALAPPVPLLLYTLGRAAGARKAWWVATAVVALVWAALVGAALVPPPEGLASGGAAADVTTTTLEPVSQAINDGYVARCKDGNFSNNLDFGKTCSGGDGIDIWLATYGQCRDETVIIMKPDAGCGSHGGFRSLLPVGYEPTPKPSDVAKCKNGLYSDNADFGATCSANGGVDHWLEPFGQCVDGRYIIMSTSASCSSGGFRALVPADPGPVQQPGDVARCGNRLFSDNTDFGSTCSANGGVESWLAAYAECNNGQVIELDHDASCSVHGGFKQLRPDYLPPAEAPVPEATTADVSAGDGLPDGNDGIVDEAEWLAASILFEANGYGYVTSALSHEDAQEFATVICEAAARSSSSPSLMLELYVNALSSGFTDYEAQTVVPGIAGALMAAACDADFDRLFNG